MADNMRVTTQAAYVELRGNDSLRVTAVAAYVEHRGGDVLRVTSTRAYLELSGEDKLRVSTAAAYVELTPPAPVVPSHSALVTTAAAYVELRETGEESETRVTNLIIVAGAELTGILMPRFILYAEVLDRQIRTTKFGSLVEIQSEFLRVTKFGALAEIEYREPPPEAPEVPTYYPKAAGTRAIHNPLPDEVTGYPLDPEYSWWATVVPEKGRNILYNPSFEVEAAVIDVYDYDGFSAYFHDEFGIVGATSGKQAARLTVAASPDNTFTYIGDHTLTPSAYTWSLDVYFNRPPGIFRLQILDGSDNVLKQKSFIVDTTGWRRVHLTWVEVGTGVRRFRVSLPAGENPVGSYFYTDSWQVEAKPYPTIYFDGDFVGFNDLQPNQSFFWEGAPHQSPSVRRANTGAGGRLVSWSDDIGFYTTGIVGLGMGPVNIRTQEMSDGSEAHISSTPVARDFTVTGRIYAENFGVLQEKAREFTRLLRPNNTRDGAQGILRFQQTDSRGNFVGAPLDIICVYKDGLGGTINNFYQQTFPIQFHASQPFPVETIESSASLETSKLLYNNGVIFKDEDGDYVNLGIGDPDAIVRRVDFDALGRPVAIGPFGLLSGDTVDVTGYWDGTQWVQMGAVPLENAYSVDGGWRYGYPTVVGGLDTVGGGVFEYDADMDAWDELGNGLNGVVHAVIRHVDGTVFAGGEFDNNLNASNASLVNIAAHYPDASGVWTSLGAGLYHTSLNGYVGTMVIHDGWLYVGGLFNEIDGNGGPDLPAHNVARWNIDEGYWDTMSSGLDDRVNGLAVSEDGFIYAVGEFERDGGDDYDLRGIARWNGNAWEEPFDLHDESGIYGADGIAVDEKGILWFFKDQLTDNHRFLVSDTIGPSETFGWKNGVFYPSFLSNSKGLWWLAIGPGNRTVMSILNAGIPATQSIGVPAMNFIEYHGDANAPMIVHLHGDMQPIHVVNLDTDGGVYFLPTLRIGENEEMVIRTDTQRSLMYSDGRANLYRYMSAGPSSSLLLHLRPGVNRISIFADEGDGAEGWLSWRNRFWGIEAASSL